MGTDQNQTTAAAPAWNPDPSTLQPVSSGWNPDPSTAQPIQQSSAQPKTQWPITPLEGESTGDTIKRAVAASKAMTPEEGQSYMKDFWKNAPSNVAKSLLGSFLAGPSLLGAGVAIPEAAAAGTTSLIGSGTLGATASGAAGGAAGGASLELLNKGLHAAAGYNVLTPQDAEDVAKAGGWGGLIGGAGGLAGGWLKGLLNSKLSRGMVNESLGATARDVTYGNPAKALLDENIVSPTTGDIEKYKVALRSGASPQDALIAAGGRTAAVAQKVKELSPMIDQALSSSPAKIAVKDVIDKPLEDAMNSIITNRAMTQAEKDTAVNQIGALQQSLKEGLGDTISPLQANQIKQALGNRINWAGNIAVTDEVKPAYRSVFGTLKQAVNNAVPEVAQTNERLTNLLSAQTDLQRLMQAEEVGQGKGALGSAVTGIARRAEAVAGRGIPALSGAQKAFQPYVPLSGSLTLGSKLNPDVQIGQGNQ